MSLGQCVGVDGDKQVGLVLVGNVGTRMQRNKHVRLAGVYHLHVRTVLFHQFTEGQRHIQVDGLLLGNLAHCASVIATVSGINDQGKPFVGSNNAHCHTHH